MSCLATFLVGTRWSLWPDRFGTSGISRCTKALRVAPLHGAEMTSPPHVSSFPTPKVCPNLSMSSWGFALLRFLLICGN